MFNNLQKDNKDKGNSFAEFFQNSLKNYKRSCGNIPNNNKDICNKLAVNYESKKSNIFSSIYYDRYVYYRDWLNSNPMNSQRRKKDSNYIW